jgi:sortase A
MARGLLGLALLALSGGLILAGDEARIRVKAALAGLLIDRALAAHLSDGEVHPPWEWADMHPIAEILVPRLGVRRVVLTGATGESMAFGLGHVDGTASPGTSGNVVIAGHRDTEAAFLRHVRIGDEVSVHTATGWRAYMVRETAVVSMRDGWVVEPSADDQLRLVTCYPFSGLRGGEQRYVVIAF